MMQMYGDDITFFKMICIIIQYYYYACWFLQLSVILLQSLFKNVQFPFSACFSAFACDSALPPPILFQPWQECVFVTLKRA